MLLGSILANRLVMRRRRRPILQVKGRTIVSLLTFVLLGLSVAQGQSDSSGIETQKNEVRLNSLPKATENTPRIIMSANRDVLKESNQIQTVGSDGLTPIPFAVVFNKNSGQSVMTDVTGNATVSRSAMMDTLVFRSIGFMDMVVYPGDPIPQKIRMVEDLISLETAEVVSQGLGDAQSSSLSMQRSSFGRPVLSWFNKASKEEARPF